MIYNFDEEIDRHNTNCLKYDFAGEMGVDRDALPMWVADMDFRTAPCITDALRKEADHGIFGYSEMKEDYFNAVSGWYTRHFGWTPKQEWLVKTPGVVFALAVCVRAFTQPGDAIIIQPPVYYPFARTIRNNGRREIDNPLVCRNGRYEIDFDDFEQKIRTEHVKMFIHCSPQNPVGRVWTREELERLQEICMKYHVIVICDEIHSDFVWDENVHYPMLSLEERFQENTVVCTAASKSFNLAGLQCSNIFIADRELRDKFREEIDRQGAGMINVMGLIATKAAYEGGEEWLSQAKAYIHGNIEYMDTYIRQNIPSLRMTKPEGTYLVWVDFRALGLSDRELQGFTVNRAHLWLDEGSLFGEGGSGFGRFNTACTRRTMEKAMTQLKAAVDSLS